MKSFCVLTVLGVGLGQVCPVWAEGVGAAALSGRGSWAEEVAPASITGGSPTAVGQYPTTVAIDVDGGLCTGTLISAEWIVTAAHCLSPAVLGLTQPEITASVRVHVDTVDLGADAGRVLTATATTPHPGFDADALGNHDIGLIRLATPVADRAVVPLNLRPDRALIGLPVTMVGFGKTSQEEPESAGVQRAVDQVSISCARGGLSNDGLLCFLQTNGKGKCQGDSGGPSFATIDGERLQVGVSSFGDPDCTLFSADTRIDAETAFLFEHVPELQCGGDGACADVCGQGALPPDPDCGEEGSGCSAAGGGASQPLWWCVAALVVLGYRRRGRGLYWFGVNGTGRVERYAT